MTTGSTSSTEIFAVSKLCTLLGLFVVTSKRLVCCLMGTLILMFVVSVSLALLSASRTIGVV